MNTHKYIVRLTDEERRELEVIVKKFKGTAQKVRRAMVLLKADADGPNWCNERIRELTGLRLLANQMVEEFVACMEEVIEVYHRPPNPQNPVVAMDEQPIQLLKETREIIPAAPAGNGHAGHPERVDYEYERNGTASVFMFVAPFANWRRVSVRQRRTKQDWAEEIEQLVMRDFKDAKKITIVLDNLNTHTKGALYTRFAPAYCLEILRRCEFIYTPIHGSWLNIAENELSVLTNQCLCGCLGDLAEVRRQVAAWTTWRNTHARGVRWQFTTDNARIKLDSVYPKYQFDDE